MSTSSCTSIYFRLRTRTVSMHATPETETTGVPVRHIQRLYLETFRTDSPSSSSHVVASAFPDAGRKINELTKTYVYAGIVPKTVSETDDSRPILLFCSRSTPLRCQLSLRCSRTHLRRLSLRCSTMRLLSSRRQS